MKPARLRQSVRAALAGMVTNAVLAIVKLATGMVGNSYALIADAIESFADIASSLIVWRGMVIADRPADADHPYGHGRAETLAAAAVSVMLVGAAAFIIYQSVHEIRRPHASPEPYTLFVLLGVVFVKEGLYRFVKGIGREIESDAVTTDAWHHRSDAITSAAAGLGISVTLVGGERFRSADEWAAIFAGVIIAVNGWRLLRPSLAEFMDKAPDTDVTGAARNVALSVPGVKGVEKCLARTLGHGYILEMHIEVDGKTSVLVAHELSHQVEDAILAQLPRINEVTVHIEPFSPS